jgi:hypothetical protein
MNFNEIWSTGSEVEIGGNSQRVDIKSLFTPFREGKICYGTALGDSQLITLI